MIIIITNKKYLIIIKKNHLSLFVIQQHTQTHLKTKIIIDAFIFILLFHQYNIYNYGFFIVHR